MIFNAFMFAVGVASGMGLYRYLLTTESGAAWIEKKAAEVAAAKAKLKETFNKG